MCGLSELPASCPEDHAVVAIPDEKVIDAAVGRAAHDRGLEVKKNLRNFEREIPVQRKVLGVGSEVDGRVMARELRSSAAGAVMLFGPPGTATTAFAKAIAVRPEWSFTEVLPSRLAADPGACGCSVGDLPHDRRP